MLSARYDSGNRQHMQSMYSATRMFIPMSKRTQNSQCFHKTITRSGYHPRATLVAPYCAIPRDLPLWRACEVEVRYSPLKRGISAILARYPLKTRQMGAIPPSATLSRKGIARYGGVSRTGPLSAPLRHQHSRRYAVEVVTHSQRA